MQREHFGNLVISRTTDESVRVLHAPSGQVLWVSIASIRGERVRLSFSGPREFEVFRRELVERPETVENP